MDIIEIKNVGPIKNIKIQLNRINVFMGRQSSGKSTIAKIISYCQWVEKRFILEGKFDYKFSEQFLEFHRIDESYFSKDSLISYKSEFISLSYKGKEKLEELILFDDLENFEKSKNIYIPAERNFASSIPNLGRYNETNDNIMSFLYDWHDAKKTYSKKNPLSILDLGVSYHSDENELDILKLDKINKSISLQNASSGLQSIIPLMILVDYMTKGVFKKNTPPSVKEKLQLYHKDRSLLQKYLKNELENIKESQSKVGKLTFEKHETFQQEMSDIRKRVVELELLMSEVENIDKEWRNYSFSKIIIEEPEQNLFPSTQRDVIYYILNNLFSDEKNHSLTITTHSPYILYALNNCIMAHKVQDKLSDMEKSKLNCLDSAIPSKNISIYEITDGEIKIIQQEDGLIGENFFDEKMKEIMNEFYIMLNHYS